MTRQPGTAKTIIQAMQRSDRRSSLFWWMVEHHDEIKAASAGQRISWKAFCERAAAEGLTDTRGGVPKERNARETWRVARRFVAATARSAQCDSLPPRPRPVHPSRILPDWRPQEIPQMSATPVPTTPPESAPSESLVPARPAGSMLPLPPAVAPVVQPGTPADPALPVPQPAQQSAARSPVPFAATRTKEEVDALMQKIDAELKEFDRKRFGSFGGG